MEIAVFFSNLIKNGYAAADPRRINLKNLSVKEFFITGISLIQNGICNIDVILDYIHSLHISNGTMSNQELLESALLKKILPIIQNMSRDDFLTLAATFCSPNNYPYIETLFLHPPVEPSAALTHASAYAVFPQK